MHTSTSTSAKVFTNRTKIQLLLLAITLCGFLDKINAQLLQTLSNDTCAADTTTIATASDGYLSNFVYYASFKRELNSTIRFRNPFAGQANITQGAIQLWIKLPAVSSDGSSQRGRIFDCNNTMSARLDDRLVGFNLTQNYNFTNGTTNATLMRTQQFANMHSGDNSIYLAWNHLTFSFYGRRMRIHLNGLQVNETNLSYTLTNTTRNADFCMVGNSINYTDPLAVGFIRHLVFLNIGYPSNTSLVSRMRYIYSAADYYSSVLSYFQFSRYSLFNETYQYNVSRQIEPQNVSITFDSEPESVCFQPSTSQQYMQLTPNYTLASLNLTEGVSHLNLSNGIVVQLWIFPLKYNFDSSNFTTILKITNFTDIILTNNGSQLSTNLYSQNLTGASLNQTVNFTTRRLPYHTWTLVTIQITNNQSVLYFDNQEIERRNHTANLTQNLSSVLISSDIGQSLEALVYRMNIAHKINLSSSSNISSQVNQIYLNPATFQNLSGDSFAYLINVQTTADQIKNGSYVSDAIYRGYFETSRNDTQLNPSSSSSAFSFMSNNLLSVGQNETTLAALWNSRSNVCRNIRFSTIFNGNGILANISQNITNLDLSKLSGQNNSLRFQIISIDTYTVDFWFKISSNISALINNTLQSYLEQKNTSNSQNSNSQADNNIGRMRFLQENTDNQNTSDPSISNGTNFYLDQIQTFGYNQTLLSSYETSPNQLQQLLRISLNVNFTNSSVRFSIICNPYSRDSQIDFLSLRQASNSISEGIWLHYSCAVNNSIKNLSSDSSLSVQSMILNSVTKVEESSTSSQNQSYKLSNSTSPIPVFIASNNDSSDQFTGFIKEIRIFSAIIQNDVMRLIRNQKTPESLKPFMSYYVGLTNGLNPVVDDRSRSIATQQTYLSQPNIYASFRWIAEDQLLICNNFQYFNGRCCVPLNLTATISQQETSDLLIINSLLAQDTILNKQSNFTWKLTSVMPNNSAYFDYINNTLSSQSNMKTLSFNRSALFRNSSFVLQLSIFSIYSSMPQTQSYAVVITCPLLNIDWPQNTLLHPWGYTPKLSMNAVISTDCYNQTITTRNITWSYNFTLGDPATLTTTKTNLTFSNESRILNDTTYQVNLSVNFSNNQVLNASRFVRYLSKPIIFNISNSSYYLPANQPLVIDANSTQFLTNTINSSLLSLQVNCFTPVQFANQSCAFNSTGFFVVNNSLLTSQNPLIPYVDYYFNLSAGQPNSTLLMRQNIQARWYNPAQKTVTQNCPGLSVLDQVNVSKQNVSNFIFYPTFYLDCLSSDQATYLKFNITNVSYTLDTTLLNQYAQQFNQSLGIKNFSDGFITQNNSLVFRINSTIVSKIKAGDIIPINITMNATNGTSNLTFTDSKILLINVVYADIVIVANSTANSSGFIAFETPLVLNASLSYDPDMNVSTTVSNNTMLNYTYLCNGKACALNSTQMKGGVIQMTILDALSLNYSYLTNYIFSIGVYNTQILRKPIQWANFSVIFAPPNKTGTVNCPRVYFIRQNSTTANQAGYRQSSYVFNTMNSSNAEWRIAYENCDTFTTYTPIMMLIDVGYQELTDNNTIQIQSKTLNSTNITMPRSRQLNNIKILQTTAIRATLIFNFTNTTTKLSRLGYSAAELSIYRDFSLLQPVLNVSSSVQIPYEDTIYVSSEGSYDPDYDYRSITLNQTQSSLADLNSIVPFNLIPKNNPAFFIQQRTCSQNIGSLCDGVQLYQVYSISKFDRDVANVKSVGSQFWIAHTLYYNNRTSQINNISFQVVAQDYSKCIAINDRMQNISIQKENYRMMRYLQPRIQANCDYVQMQNDLTWSSSASQQFWSVNGLSNQEVAITPEAIAQYAQNQTLDLSFTFQYFPSDFPNQILTYRPFYYSIQILPTLPTVIINLTEPFDLSLQNTTINIYLNNTQSISQAIDLSKNLCNVSASINDEQIDNLTQSQQCSFDIMAALQTIYQANEIASLKLIVLFANVTLQDGSVYQAKKAITISVNSLAPQCSIIQDTNPYMYLDKPLTLQASAVDLTVGQLDFFWDTQTYFRNIIPTVRELSRLTLNQFALLPAQGKNMIIESSINSVGQDAASQNDCRAAYLISLPSNENIILGQTSIVATDYFIQSEVVGLTFSSDYQDLNQGDLLISIYYLQDGRNYTLMTKTLLKNLTLIVPETDSMFLEVTDQQGGVKLQSIDLSNMTLPYAEDLSIQFISFYQKLLGNSIEGGLSLQDAANMNLELMLGTYEQASLRLKAVQSQVQIEQLYSYYTDILVQTQTILLKSKTYLNLQDSRVNAQFIALRAFNNLMDSWLQINFTALEWSTENNTFMQTYLTSMQAIPRKIYEKMTSAVDPSLMQLVTLRSQWMADVYSGLVQKMLIKSNLSPSEQQELQLSSKSIFDSWESKLNPGESLEIASQNLVIKKIDINDMPKAGFVSSNKNIDFSVAKDQLIDLLDQQAYLNIQIMDESAFANDNFNLTLASDIVTINFTSLNGSEIDFTDRVALISFSNVDTYNNQGLQCTYWDETNQVWLYYAQQSKLTTQVVNSSKQVFCKTTHLSTFAVFNVTEYQNSTDPNGGGSQGDKKTRWEETPTSTKRIIISIIQIVFILVAINAFIINTRFEFQKAAIFKEYSYAALQHRLKIIPLFLQFAKIFQIFRHDRAPLIVRVQITLSYILFVAFLVLLNLVFLGTDRVVEDDVYLVFTVWLVITLFGPYILNITLYKFYQFIPQGQFSDILQSKSLGPYSQRQGGSAFKGPHHNAPNQMVGMQKNESGPGQVSSNPGGNNHNTAPFQNMIYDSAQEVKSGGGNPLKKSQLTQQYQSQQLHTSANMILIRNQEIAGPEEGEEAKINQQLDKDQEAMQLSQDLHTSMTKSQKYKTQKINRAGTLDSSTDHKPRHPMGGDLRQSLEFDNETEIEAAKRTALNIQDSSSPRSLRSRPSLKSNQDDYAAGSIESKSERDTPTAQKGLSHRNINQLNMNLNAHSLKKVNDISNLKILDKSQSESDNVEDSDSDRAEEATSYNPHNQQVQARRNNYGIGAMERNYNLSSSQAMSNNINYSQDPTQMHSQFQGNATSLLNRQIESVIDQQDGQQNSSYYDNAFGRVARHNDFSQGEAYNQSSSVYPKDYYGHQQDNSAYNQNYNQQDEEDQEFQFEGGDHSDDDQANHNPYTAQRMNSSNNQPQQRSRAAKYEISEADPAHIHPNRLQQMHTLKDIDEKVVIQTKLVVVIYLIVLLFLIAADIVLFYFSQIDVDVIYKAFIADMLISLGIQIFVLDLIICISAAMIIRNTGLQKIASIKGVIVFGFFNISRLRAM